jgi:hypothetical protein
MQWESRSVIEYTNTLKSGVTYDFAFAEYLSSVNFYELLSEVQVGLAKEGKATLPSGVEVDLSSPGGLLALQLFMENVDATRQAHSGLSRLGLNVEKQLWKNI